VSIDRGQFVFLLEPAAVEQNVDLAHLETADLEIDLRCKFEDFGEFEGKRLAVPCGVVGNAVERQPQHAEFGLGQVRETNRRDLAEAQLSGGQHECPAMHDPSLGVGQGRKNETEPVEARRELAHLMRRMLSGLSPQGLTACDRDELRGQIT
jgi:hypothetical protein